MSAWKRLHAEDRFAAEFEKAMREPGSGLITLWASAPTFLLAVVAFGWVMFR